MIKYQNAVMLTDAKLYDNIKVDKELADRRLALMISK